MKVVGGKVIPGSNGVLGAYVAKVYAGGVVETLGEVNEGQYFSPWEGAPFSEYFQGFYISSSTLTLQVIKC